MIENAIVAGIVVVAAAYLLRRHLKKGSQPSCGCGCSGCGVAGSCSGADKADQCPSGHSSQGLDDLRPPRA